MTETYWYQVALASLSFVVLICGLHSRRQKTSSKERVRKLPPGPRGWPIVGNIGLLLGKLPHHVFRDLSKVYGPIFFMRLGSVPSIVISSPKLVGEVLQNHDHIFDRRPATAAAEIVGRGKSITFAHGDYWRYTRNIATRELLSKSRVKSYKGVRRARMLEVLRSLAEVAKTGEPLVIRDRMFPFITSTFSETMLQPRKFFGKGQESVISMTEKQLQDRILEAVVLFGVFNIGDYIPLLKRFDLQGYEKRMRKISQEIDDVMGAIMEEKRKAAAAARINHDDDHVKDFMDVLLSLPGREGKKSLHEDVIKILPMEMIVAANDSTNATIEWSLTQMIKNPEVKAKAQHELDTVVGQERLVEENDLPDLKYLQACVKEVLRLHPPSPLLLPHESSAHCVVAGYHIPAKTQLYINVHAIGRDPTVWENPDAFLPERFLEAHPNFKPGMEVMQGTLNPHFEYTPFGWGRRSCPGVNLGYVTVQQTLARILQCFDIKLPPGVTEVDMGETYGIAVLKEVPLQLVVTQRVPSSLMDTSQ